MGVSFSMYIMNGYSFNRAFTLLLQRYYFRDGSWTNDSGAVLLHSDLPELGPTTAPEL